MASAAPDTVQEDLGASAGVDFEAEAKKMGWTPLEAFKGDPNHHLDAETFYTRAVEYMPIAKATIKRLSERLDRAEKEAKRAAEFFSKGEQRAYDRALAEIRAEQEAAVESGDLDAHRKAAEKLDKLEKPTANDDVVADEDQRAEEFADWGKANKWYAADPVMQAYADAQAQRIAKTKNGGFLDRSDLDEVTERVKAKFADDFPEAFGEAKPARRSPVEGVSPGRGKSNGRSFNDLPAEAKAMCDKWVKNGTIKSRDDYVKNYAW